MTPTEAKRRLVEAGSNDAKITAATIDLAVSAFPERQQALLRSAVLAAAVPHWFDDKIVASLLNVSPKVAKRLVNSMQGFSFVERHLPREAWNIHERTRDHILREMFRNDVERYRLLSARAVLHFQKVKRPEYQLEAAYHLIVAEKVMTKDWVHGLIVGWRQQGDLESGEVFARLLEEHISGNRLEGLNLARALAAVATLKRSSQPATRTIELLKQGIKEFEKLGDLHGAGAELDQLGAVLTGIDRYEDAIKALRAALVIAEQLLRKSRHNRVRRANVAATLQKIGVLYSEVGNIRDATKALKRAQGIVSRLLRASSTNELQSHLAKLYGDLARAYFKGDEPTKAVRALKKSRSVLERILRKQTDHPGYQHDLAVTLVRLGIVYVDQGQIKQAMDVGDRVKTIANSLHERFPEDLTMHHLVASAHGLLGKAYIKAAQPRQALDAFGVRAQILEVLVSQDPAQVGWLKELQFVRHQLSELGQSDEVEVPAPSKHREKTPQARRRRRRERNARRARKSRKPKRGQQLS